MSHNRAIKNLIDVLRDAGVSSFDDGEIKVTFHPASNTPVTKAVTDTAADEQQIKETSQSPDFRKMVGNMQFYSSAGD